MKKNLSKKTEQNKLRPEWLKPGLYDEWMKGATVGELLVEILSRIDFLNEIKTNLADFGGTLDCELNHFLFCVKQFGLSKWASMAKKEELKENAKAIYSRLKPVAIDDVLMVIKTIQGKGEAFSMRQEDVSEPILFGVKMLNRPVDEHLNNEMWLKVDMRNLNPEQFGIEAILYSFLYRDRFSKDLDKLPLVSGDYLSKFIRFITHNPLAYLDLLIWKVLNGDAIPRSNLVQWYFETIPMIHRSDQVSYYTRTVDILMVTMIGVDVNGAVSDKNAAKKLTAWLSSFDPRSGCSYLSSNIVDFKSP